MSTETETITEKETTEQTTQQPENTAANTSNNNDPLADLEKDFAEFQNSKSEHTVEPEVKTEQTNQDEFIPTEINMVEKFKLQMFLGLFFLMLDGMHLFMYRFISKLDIKKDDIALDESDQESLSVYFQTPRVLALINKLPSELIGLVHIEYLYWQKFEEIKKDLQKIEKKDPEKKPVAEKKQAPRKKARPKRKPAKKSAAKKTAKVADII